MNKVKRRALICGVSGQDGAYLAQLLLSKGYEVWGTSRDAQVNAFDGLHRLGIFDKVQILSMSVVDFRSILQIVTKVNPDEIYNLSGQSSVSLSFSQPVEANESINLGTLNLLEVIRFVNPKIRFYNAGSSDCFGDTGSVAATEETPFRPRSPYAVAKAAATMQVSVYREAYGLFACTGILFNHESPLRPDRFVTRKIVATACRIAQGSDEKLRLGNIEIVREWGWAPEYIEAMWKMLNQENPSDYIVGTGTPISLSGFVQAVFDELNLDWTRSVEIENSLLRPSDPKIIIGNPSKANDTLGWQARTVGSEVARALVRCELSGMVD
jgi:GDPmannose 4,6-dehydratase